MFIGKLKKIKNKLNPIRDVDLQLDFTLNFKQKKLININLLKKFIPGQFCSGNLLPQWI